MLVFQPLLRPLIVGLERDPPHKKCWVLYNSLILPDDVSHFLLVLLVHHNIFRKTPPYTQVK